MIDSKTIYSYLLLILKLIPFYFDFSFLIFTKQIYCVGVVVKNYSFLVEKNIGGKKEEKMAVIKISDILKNRKELSYEELKKHHQFLLSKMRNIYEDEPRAKLQKTLKIIFTELKTREEFKDDETYIRKQSLSKYETRQEEKKKNIVIHNVNFSNCGFDKSDALKMMSIFKLTAPNSRVYIGISLSKNLSGTLYPMIRKLNLNEYDNKELQEDWTRFGEKAFKIEVLKCYDNEEKAITDRREIIDKLLEEKIDLYNIRL